ncbi:MAG: succinate dehydrogenase assembly factor 2 [Alphaproteobacteria bacterium]|nr:succinate dehydrogenase assembly factor 2 [Alphaproteobacteria bacterium]
MTDPDISTTDRRRERLRFRSWHRGTREMDLLMGSFADLNLPAYSDAQLDEYEVILGISDPDLYNWMTGKEPVPPEYDNQVMRALCAHQFAPSSSTKGVS